MLLSNSLLSRAHHIFKFTQSNFVFITKHKATLRQKEKGAAEDEMVAWHQRLNGHESEQTPGDSEGQGSLVCCHPRGRTESDTTERLKTATRRKQ